MTDTLLRLPAVRAETGLSTSTIYRLMDADRFPRPVQLTETRVAWWASEIADWLRSRPRTLRASERASPPRHPGEPSTQSAA
jgi:prophage regulatory protein